MNAIQTKTMFRILLTACAFVLIPAVSAVANDAASVTYLKGKAYISSARNGPWQPLVIGAKVTANHFIKTGTSGLIELTLPDRSVVRLAPNTFFKIDQSFFPPKLSRRFSARLLLGKMWAKVTHRLGKPRGTFDTHTPTMVAGVRGTVYDLRTAGDKSTDIRVYEGKVAVGPPLIAKDAPKEEVAWPKEVSEQQWEEIILVKLQKLHIGSDGRPGRPARFDPEKEKDSWTEWNLQRDKLQK